MPNLWDAIKSIYNAGWPSKFCVWFFFFHLYLSFLSSVNFVYLVMNLINFVDSA